ncbi:MAG: arylesterase [Bdellovibrionaceae bacterium]|nr:arylesterase [Pseudobdellovibrionaceae bacterium]MBX3034517.1 arylesterase [Pseudobdellovibrionaceae bacterium]
MRLIILSLLLGFSLAHADAPGKKMVILGDSLTEGYGVAKEAAFPAVLEKKIKDAGKKWTVVNAGVSGSTTASAVSRMKWVFKSKPDLLILCLGANDGLRGLKVADSKKHLAAAIEYAQSRKVKVILGGLYMPPNYGKDYSRDFRAMYEDLARTYKLSFVPFLLEGVGGKPEYNLADGIHPNEKGHALIADNVYKNIKDLL